MWSRRTVNESLARPTRLPFNVDSIQWLVCHSPSRPGLKKPGVEKPNLAGFIRFGVLLRLLWIRWMSIPICCQMNAEWEND